MKWRRFSPRLPKVSVHVRLFIAVMFTAGLAGFVALPDHISFHQTVAGRPVAFEYQKPNISHTPIGKLTGGRSLELKQGLDIQGGMQVILEADMKEIPEADRQAALESARSIIERRVNLYGVNEPVVQTAQQGVQQRIIVELAGVRDTSTALNLIGTTAVLDFRLRQPKPSPSPTTTPKPKPGASPLASPSATPQTMDDLFSEFQSVGLTGKQLKRALLEFDQQTGEPVIGLEFNDEGRKIFADVTTAHVGEVLAIFLDEYLLMLPQIKTAIVDGRAQLSGGFSLEEAKQMSIQLNAGALPVPIRVLEQRTIGASLGQTSVQQSVIAGCIGIVLVMLFMVFNYGAKGLLASVSLTLYAIFTIALYKLLGVTLTLPGIAGLLLSVGMAVDGNILIFERMKEELRAGKSPERAMELGFGRAWDSIKDANLTTIFTALVLINPLDFAFLSSSGLVRGFGITLLLGVAMSLFTGLVVTRTLLRLFLNVHDDGAGRKMPLQRGMRSVSAVVKQ
jgi:preprotein translocase subunit SecD